MARCSAGGRRGPGRRGWWGARWASRRAGTRHSGCAADWAPVRQANWMHVSVPELNANKHAGGLADDMHACMCRQGSKQTASRCLLGPSPSHHQPVHCVHRLVGVPAHARGGQHLRHAASCNGANGVGAWDGGTGIELNIQTNAPVPLPLAAAWDVVFTCGVLAAGGHQHMAEPALGITPVCRHALGSVEMWRCPPGLPQG